MRRRRVALIGWDSAPPSLVLDRLLEDLPTLRRLVREGKAGPLRSCHPPITVPAWMVALTGRNPGHLGVYGFRSRKGRSYTEVGIPSSETITAPKVWDRLGEAGRQSLVVGVPPTYPPRPLQGALVSCFLTPGTDTPFTYPEGLRGEVSQVVGEYRFDIEFRKEERDRVLRDLFDMTERRWRLVEHLATTRLWDFLAVVEIGVDRLHHAFWKFFDPQHPRYPGDNPYRWVAREYYRMLDHYLGRLVERFGEETLFLVASDHGTKAMKGALCVNEWLYQEGYLVLKRYPERPVPLERAEVDWARTRAWAWGGYYARVFLNVEGREPQGVIPPSAYEAVRQELAEGLARIPDPQGRPMRTRVYRPEDLYPEVRGDASDLMVYFDDLDWRSAGTLGHGRLYLEENDTGPDDAVHDWDGILVMWGPGVPAGASLNGASLPDLAPTLLHALGLPIPEEMEGRPLL